MLLTKESITDYLKNILGISDLRLTPHPQAKKLPYLLQDQFEFLQIKLSKHLVALAIPKVRLPIRQMRNVLAQLANDQPLILCFESLASYERRYLIEQKISFLVPGNQLYLLELGIDLREYFRQKKITPTHSLNPASQAMLIWYLQNSPAMSSWSPSEIAPSLGYTSMTASRVVSELVELNLFEELVLDRRKYLRTDDSHEQIWEKAKPYLKNPVKQEIWVRKPIHLPLSENYLAGISALSELTMINSDNEICYALSPNRWKEIKEKIVALPEKEPGSTCYQIWAYEPKMYRVNSNTNHSSCVDTHSLWLSFRDNPDSRIQLALIDLEKEFSW